MTTTGWDHEPTARELGIAGGGDPLHGALAPGCKATLPDPKGSGLRMRCTLDADHAPGGMTTALPTHEGVTSLGGDWRWTDEAEGANPHRVTPASARPEALEHTLPDPEVTNTRAHDHRTFRLVRDVDPTGVSGLGVVAEGVQFSDGRVALRWIGAQGKPSTACWDSLADMLVVHGHQGATRVEWT